MAAIKTAIARQQPVALSQRVRADQEIGCHALAFTALRAVFPPHCPGLERRLMTQRGKAHPENFHGLEKPGLFRKNCGGFRPDHLARHDRALGEALAEGGRRRAPELRVGSENIEQDIRVNGGDHGVARSSRMTASVLFPSLTQPKTRSTGSASASLTATSRPFSSWKSSVIP